MGTTPSSPSVGSKGPTTPRGTDYPACDPTIDPFCQPIGPFPPVGGGGGGSSSSTDVTVTVTVPVTVTPTPLRVDIPTTGITQAISGAIDASNQDSINAVNTLATNLQANLGGIASGLNQFVDQSTALITEAVDNAVRSSFAPATLILGAISNDVLNLGAQIGNVEGGIVGPILDATNHLAVQFANSFASVGDQLGHDLAGIGATLDNFLPKDVDALNNIAHWIEILTGHFPGWGTSTIDWGNIANIAGDLKQMGAAIAGIAGAKVDTTVHPGITLTQECGIERGQQVINQWLSYIPALPYPLNKMWDLILGAIAQIVSILPMMEKTLDVATENVNKLCPLTRLDPGLVAAFVRKGIITSDAGVNELRLQGFSDDRIAAIFSGTRFFVGPADAIEYWYRGIIDSSTLTTTLKANGYDDNQIIAAKSASVRLVDPGSLIQAFRFGYITESELDQALTVQRFDAAQAQLIKTIAFRRPTPGEVSSATARSATLGQVSIPFLTGFFDIPQWYVDSGRQNGWDNNTIQYNWTNHWNILSPGDWIQLYFRGNRNLAEVEVAMDAAMIPRTLQTDLIDVNRPLIPFRTVPAMLKGGVLTLDRARQILAKHGFADPDIETLLAYASIPSKSTKTGTANAQHNVSMATAKTLYEDGAITQAQFAVILEAHGLDTEAVQLEIELSDITDQARVRKQVGSDVVNEFLAGMISHDQAVTDLANSGLTVAEQARYVRQLRTGATAKAKLPTEAEARAMAVKDVITIDQYRTHLVNLGYSPDWAQSFVDLHFPGTPFATTKVSVTP
jgi:hypothetical protein